MTADGKFYAVVTAIVTAGLLSFAGLVFHAVNINNERSAQVDQTRALMGLTRCETARP